MQSLPWSVPQQRSFEKLAHLSPQTRRRVVKSNFNHPTFCLHAARETTISEEMCEIALTDQQVTTWNPNVIRLMSADGPLKIS
jgi:hypothetical protein